MNIFHSIIYTPKINWLLRNINYLFSPFLPEKIKIHPSGTLKVKIKNYPSIKLRTNQTSYVTRELFWKGSKKYEYTPIFIELIKKSNTFFDIGASIGYYSILSATINKELHVEAFEPSVGSMIYLSENVKINKLSARININVLALSNKIGQIDFFDIKNKKYPTIYNLSGEHNLGTKPQLISNKTKSESDTLDHYMEKNQINTIDLIKIDTEGCEDLVLTNGSNTIEKFKPIIICETLFDRIEPELEKIMLGHGYSFYNHKNNGLYKVDAITRTSDNGVRNCFFVHPTKEHLIKQFIKLE